MSKRGRAYRAYSISKADCDVPRWLSDLLDSTNNDDLIAEVERHPALWDPMCPENGDYAQRERAWYQVCSKMDPAFEGRELLEKRTLCKLLQKRWRHLRDCFTREFRRLKTPNDVRSSFKRKRRYIYYEQMQFLEKVVHKTKSSLDNDAGENENYYEEQELELTPAEEQEDIKQNLTCDESQQKRKSEDESLPSFLTEKITGEVMEYEDYCDEMEHPLPEEDFKQNLTCEFQQKNISESERLPSVVRENSTAVTGREDDCDNRQVPLPEGYLMQNLIYEPQQSRKSEETRRPVVLREKYHTEVTGHFDDYDSDRLFMMSLVGELKKVPSSKRMMVKSQMMNLIHQHQVYNE